MGHDARHLPNIVITLALSDTGSSGFLNTTVLKTKMESIFSTIEEFKMRSRLFILRKIDLSFSTEAFESGSVIDMTKWLEDLKSTTHNT